MSQHIKKKIITSLLFASCVASAILLFTMPSRPSKNFENLSQTDSLLHLTFQQFNLKKGQIYAASIRVDSNFIRKSYVLSIKSGFPKTKFHLALKNRLHSYGIQLPAQIIFPKKGMQVQLVYHQTIITTINLRIK